MGWSSEDSSLQLGTDAEGFGSASTGMKVNRGKYNPFPSKNNKVLFSEGDVVGCHPKLLPCVGNIPNQEGRNEENKDKVAATISSSKIGEMFGQGFEVTGTAAHTSLYPTMKLEMDKVEDQVKQLALTESLLQTDYWMLRNMFNSIASK